MRIGVLTGGADCPGSNAAIRAVVRKGIGRYGHGFLGFRDGWRGVLTGETSALGIAQVRGILPRGGTILGTSRTNPLALQDGIARIRHQLHVLGVDALIVIGGQDTLGVATALHAEGVRVIGIPKTIDNDLSATDYTFGFDTALGVATAALDRLHTTAESHHRVLVVEVMGRHAGWIALHAGMAGGASLILIPEVPFDLDQVARHIQSRFKSRYAPIVVVAEGALPQDATSGLTGGGRDSFGHLRLGGIGEYLAAEIEARTGAEARAVALGHIQRGGTPSPFDRWLATRCGLHAIDAAHDHDWGTMVALRGTDIVRVPLAEATGAPKLVDPARYTEAAIFFG